MSNSEEMKHPETGSKQSKWGIVLIVVLAICALPVLLPLGLGIGACGLGLVLAVGGCLLGLLLGGTACIFAGLVGLAALLAGGVVGIGVGIVILFTAPASGLAVLGMSLMAVGGAVLGSMLVWQLFKLCIKAVRWLVNKIGASSRRHKAVSASEESVSAVKNDTAEETVGTVVSGTEEGTALEEKAQEQEENSDEA